MRLALALPFALAAMFYADPELQPECRRACEAQYQADLAACREQTRQPYDECQDAADDRHQDCLDRCNG